jgi:hypothetical protein
MRLAACAIFSLTLLACQSSGNLTGQTGRREQSSTNDFEVVVEQAVSPMVMPSHDDAQVRFDVTVFNHLPAPLTIQRISLQSMGGAGYSIPVTTREYTKVIEPGASETIEFWAAAAVSDATMGTHVPVTIRTTVEAVADGKQRREEFMNRVNGHVTTGVTRRPSMR